MTQGEICQLRAPELGWALCQVPPLTLATLFSFSSMLCPCLQGDHQVEEIPEPSPPRKDCEEFMPEEHFVGIVF